MGDMREAFEPYKEKHRQRVAKNPERIAYAKEQLEKHGIEYTLKNEATGHFHCRSKTDDSLIQFWAGTGKIMGYANVRGIHNLIKICEGEKPSDLIKIREEDNGLQYQGGKSRIAKHIAGVINEVSRWKIKDSSHDSKNNYCYSGGGTPSLVCFAEVAPLKAKLKVFLALSSMINTTTLQAYCKAFKTDILCRSTYQRNSTSKSGITKT